MSEDFIRPDDIPNDRVRQIRLEREYGQTLVRRVRRACRAATRATDDESPFVFLQTLRDTGYTVVPITEEEGATMKRNGPVSEVFEQPVGPVTLDPDGKWWITRRDLPVVDGNVEILVGDGHRVSRIAGTPDALRRLAHAITAQVEGAEVNT
jgi:hypothetical protein